MGLIASEKISGQGIPLAPRAAEPSRTQQKSSIAHSYVPSTLRSCCDASVLTKMGLSERCIVASAGRTRPAARSLGRQPHLDAGGAQLALLLQGRQAASLLQLLLPRLPLRLLAPASRQELWVSVPNRCTLHYTVRIVYLPQLYIADRTGTHGLLPRTISRFDDSEGCNDWEVITELHNILNCWRCTFRMF